jgi:hypothetical protein
MKLTKKNHLRCGGKLSQATRGTCRHTLWRHVLFTHRQACRHHPWRQALFTSCGWIVRAVTACGRCHVSFEGAWRHRLWRQVPHIAWRACRHGASGPFFQFHSEVVLFDNSLVEVVSFAQKFDGLAHRVLCFRWACITRRQKRGWIPTRSMNMVIKRTGASSTQASEYPSGDLEQAYYSNNM